jgi:hypothetical protein
MKNNKIDTDPQLKLVIDNDDSKISSTYKQIKCVTAKKRRNVKESLIQKSIKSNTNLSVIVEVFSRGISSWEPNSKHDRIQHGFNRVNSFINNGKAMELDKDLLVKENETKPINSLMDVKK